MNNQGAASLALWSGTAKAQTNQSNQNLYLTNASNDYQIGITGGNTITLPSTLNHLYVANLSTFATALNDTLLTASVGLLYANGVLVNGDTPAESNVDMWATFPAVANVNFANHNITGANTIAAANVLTSNITASTINTSTIHASIGWFSTLNVSSLNASISSFSTLNVSSLNALTLNASTINTSTIHASIGWFSTINVSSLNAPGFSNLLSNWSYYPALSDVNVNSHNINGAATVNANNVNAGGIATNSLYVGTGGTTFSGNARFNGTGNTFSPYWYNFTMDANITTGQASQLYPPTNNQFFSDSHIGVNVFDIESF